MSDDLCDETKNFLNTIPYWHKELIKDMYKDGGKNRVMEYLNNLVQYRISVKGETLDDITNGERSKFWDKFKTNR